MFPSLDPVLLLIQNRQMHPLRHKLTPVTPFKKMKYKYAINDWRGLGAVSGCKLTRCFWLQGISGYKLTVRNFPYSQLLLPGSVLHFFSGLSSAKIFHMICSDMRSSESLETGQNIQCWTRCWLQSVWQIASSGSNPAASRKVVQEIYASLALYLACLMPDLIS